MFISFPLTTPCRIANAFDELFVSAEIGSLVPNRVAFRLLPPTVLAEIPSNVLIKAADKLGSGDLDLPGIGKPYRLGSKFASSWPSVRLEVTPSAGTSTCEIHNSAFSTTLRKFSLPQLS